MNEKRTYQYYCLYGYGVPTLFLMIILIAHHIEGEHLKPGFGVNNCWFSGKFPIKLLQFESFHHSIFFLQCLFTSLIDLLSGIKETWIYFYGPIILLLICNATFFVWTSVKLQQEAKLQTEKKIKQLRYRWVTINEFF